MRIEIYIKRKESLYLVYSANSLQVSIKSISSYRGVWHVEVDRLFDGPVFSIGDTV